MSEFTIDKGIGPQPGRHWSQDKYPFESMEVGDSSSSRTPRSRRSRAPAASTASG